MSKISELEKKVEALAALVHAHHGGGGRLGVSSGSFGGVASLSDSLPHRFFGQVVATGPEGTEPDYADERYWIQSLNVSNISPASTETSHVELEPATAGAPAVPGSPGSPGTPAEDSDPHFIHTTATNISEVVAGFPGQGTHGLPLGKVVECEEIWGHEEEVLKHYRFNSGGGGGGLMSPGIVTARYGAFVTLKVPLSISHTGPVFHTNPLAVPTYEWVWCQTAHHPFIKYDPPGNPLVGDAVLFADLSPPIQVTDRYFNSDGSLAGTGQVRTVTKFMLGTVPEADLRLFAGASPGCFYTPFDTKCPLVSLAEDPRP